MIQADLGHGPIVLMQKEDGDVQLRDNLSMLWCACSKPAVHHFPQNIQPYQFKCIKCALEE